MKTKRTSRTRRTQKTKRNATVSTEAEMKAAGGGLSKEELSGLLRTAACGRRQGGLLDAATLHEMRVRLWRSVTAEFNPKAAKELMPLIVAARRAALLDEQARRARNKLEKERALTVQEQEEAVRRMYGPLPWVEGNQDESAERRPQPATEAKEQSVNPVE